MRYIVLSFLIALFLFSCEEEKFQNCVELEPDDCRCYLNYDPICGCNGKTYGNACVAECHGISEYKEGECE